MSDYQENIEEQCVCACMHLFYTPFTHLHLHRITLHVYVLMFLSGCLQILKLREAFSGHQNWIICAEKNLCVYILLCFQGRLTKCMNPLIFSSDSFLEYYICIMCS